ncbi:pirin family protein [Halioglobus maricola]|uniref:Pirin family protein n=1 Tax=Halioglobus maricola TaxID=2601894 RepID=A0A5P9NLB2_9GAMM|nr:pirin-like bicupin family protein [Halioglobus maricola]QFU76286.1 pirin family protein [Halioglobus maricola]
MDYYRRAEERGAANHGWLKSHHTFSFAHYYDPAHMGFSELRVINDDWVAPGRGFDSHSHKNMEIITYVLEGTIEHRDSMGHVSLLKAGQIQRMSAGTGIVHSEYNASSDLPLRFLQMWIRPAQEGGEPGYETLTVGSSDGLNTLVTPNGADSTLSINQNVILYRLKLAPGQSQKLKRGAGTGYIHGVSGMAEVDGFSIADGDGAGFTESEQEVNVVAGATGFEALWFSLP